jgi:hypothetical protein
MARLLDIPILPPAQCNAPRPGLKDGNCPLNGHLRQRETICIRMLDLETQLFFSQSAAKRWPIY